MYIYHSNLTHTFMHILDISYKVHLVYLILAMPSTICLARRAMLKGIL